MTLGKVFLGSKSLVGPHIDVQFGSIYRGSPRDPGLFIEVVNTGSWGSSSCCFNSRGAGPAN